MKRRIDDEAIALWIGVACIALLLAFVVLFPLFTSPEAIEPNALIRLRPPSLAHLLGTDYLGRDVATRLALGGRLSLATALFVILASAAIGMLFGGVSGLAGGWTDRVIMRFCDIVQAFPSVLLALLISYSLGGGMGAIAVAVIAAWWPFYAKLTRGLVLKLRHAAYIDAARSVGASPLQILSRHLLPHALPAVITQMTIGFGEVIVTVGGLSLMGLGAKEPTPEWGAMIAESIDYLFRAWWVPTACGLAILITSVGFNLVGDSLRRRIAP